MPKKASGNGHQARYDHTTALSSLFTTVLEGGTNNSERKKGVTIRRDHKNGWIEYHCFEQLSVYDESVTLAVLHLAGIHGRGLYLSSSPQTERGRIMRDIFDTANVREIAADLRSEAGLVAKRQNTGELAPEDVDFNTVGMIAHTSLQEIARLCGHKKPSQSNRQDVKDSLERLSKVLVSERNEREGWETHGQTGFIKTKVFDDGSISVVLARRLAMSAFGKKGWIYAIISLDERNLLSGDITKQVHLYMCAWMWQKKNRDERLLCLDKICRYVWPRWDGYSDSGKSTYRARVRNALKQINELPDWTVTWAGRGAKTAVEIRREGWARTTIEDMWGDDDGDDVGLA